jgi:hypothetical protein
MPPFANFTTKAKEVIKRAHELALERGVNNVNSYHLLTALVLLDDSPVVTMMERLETDLVGLTDELLDKIETGTPIGETVSQSLQMYLTPDLGQVLERFEAGVNLYGAEVKAFREGHADLTGSYVQIRGNEAYIINAKILPYKFARPEGYEESRTRKLLLHKKEIVSLKGKTDGGNLTIVPISQAVEQFSLLHDRTVP